MHDIDVDWGVFTPDEASYALATAATNYEGRFLDMGTGSGFITVFLHTKGKIGDACDISDYALKCAEKNFQKMNVDANLIKSNLFSNIKSQYDLIIFNPPKSSKESETQRILKNAFQNILTKNALNNISNLYQNIDKEKRRNALIEFIKKSSPFITEKGVILLNLIKNDFHWISKSTNISTKEIQTLDNRTIVEVRLKDQNFIKDCSNRDENDLLCGLKSTVSISKKQRDAFLVP